MDLHELDASILSPISSKPSKLVLTLDVDKIIDRYKIDLGIDVAQYFQGVPTVRIYQCRETGYRFFYPPHIVGDAFFYSLLMKFEWYYPKWKWENAKSLNFIQRGDTILDVGCGSGNFLFELNNKGFTSLCGIDTGAIDKESFSKKGIRFFDSTIDDFKAQNQAAFDVVCCFQILEHVTNIDSFIRSCLSVLKDGGKLIIGVPNNDPFLYKHDLYNSLNLPPHHQGLWDKSSLTHLGRFYHLKTKGIFFEPISDQIAAYSAVQVAHYSQKSPIINQLFKIKAVFKLYTKVLYLLRARIKGSTLLAVYQK